MAEIDKDAPAPGGYGSRTGEGETTWTAGSGSNASMKTEDVAKEGLDEAKQRAADMAGRAKEQGRRMFAGQKDAAAGQFDSVASALRRTADQLGEEDQSQAGEYVGFAAEKLESLGQRLRTKDLDALVGDAEDLARRSPIAFFAGSVAAGFLLSRFLKSSSERRTDPARYQSQSRSSERFAGSTDDNTQSRTSYMDTDALGTDAQTNASSMNLRTTTAAPDGGGTSTAPLPSTDKPRGGSYGL